MSHFTCCFFIRLSGAAFLKAKAGGQECVPSGEQILCPPAAAAVLGLPAQPCVPLHNPVVPPLQGGGFPPRLLHPQQHLPPLWATRVWKITRSTRGFLHQTLAPFACTEAGLRLHVKASLCWALALCNVGGLFQVPLQSGPGNERHTRMNYFGLFAPWRCLWSFVLESRVEKEHGWSGNKPQEKVLLRCVTCLSNAAWLLRRSTSKCLQFKAASCYGLCSVFCVLLF